MEQTTRERIMETSLQLFLERGFKGTTTRMIASCAGVNELTVFRNFGTKEGILKAVIQSKQEYLEKVGAAVLKTMKYDPAEDLKAMARLYFDRLLENINLVMLQLHAVDMDPEINQMILQLPIRLKAFLVEYFEELKNRNHSKNIDPELAATLFMSINIGFLLLNNRFQDHFTTVDGHDFIEKSMKALTDSLMREG